MNEKVIKITAILGITIICTAMVICGETKQAITTIIIVLTYKVIIFFLSVIKIIILKCLEEE